MITRIAAADDPQRLHVVGDRAAGEGRRDAEQREHRPEPGHEGHGVAHAAQRDGRSTRAACAATATAVSWPR